MLVVMGHTDASVSAQIGVHETTVYRWRRDPNNSEILQACRQDLIDNLKDNAQLAAAHLRGVLTDSKDSPDRQMTAAGLSIKAHANAVRAGAAQQIGDAVERAVGAGELEERRQRLLKRLADHQSVPATLDAEDLSQPDDPPRH